MEQPILRELPRSLSGTYSADNGQGDYCISGRIQVGIYVENCIHHIRVLKAEDLAFDKNRGLPNPYVKVQLWPNCSKHTKAKTKVELETINPTYNEILQIDLLHCENSQITLWVSVWDWDLYGRHLFLGETFINLSSLDLEICENIWYNLNERRFPIIRKRGGSLHFSLSISEKYLSVQIHKAINLMQDNSKSSNFFVRLMLLPEHELRTTKCISNTSNPVWNEEVVFKNFAYGRLLVDRVLEISVWDFDGVDCSEFVGCIRLGPYTDIRETVPTWLDSYTDEFCVWMEAIDQIGEWCEHCLNLRPSIACRYEHDFDIDKNSSIVADSSSEELDTSMSNEVTSQKNFETVEDFMGRILLKLEYKNDKLTLQILRADNLAVATSEGLSNPYILVYVMQNTLTLYKWRTSVKRNTINPLFNESVKFEVRESEYPECFIYLKVMHWRTSSDNPSLSLFLGDVQVSNIFDQCRHPTIEWYNFQGRFHSTAAVKPQRHKDIPRRGQLILALKFEEVECTNGKIVGTLKVCIKKARGLLQREKKDNANCFFKVFLIPSKHFAQSHNKMYSSQPVWNEFLEMDNINLEDLSTVNGIEMVLMEEIGDCSSMIGAVRIGPFAEFNDSTNCEWMDSNVLEATHWELMLSNPGEWVECCHRLRPNREFISASRRNDSDSMPPKKSETLTSIRTTSMPKTLTDENVLLPSEIGDIKIPSFDVGNLFISVMFERTKKKFRIKGNLYVKINAAQFFQFKEEKGVHAECNIFPHLQTDWKHRSTSVCKNTTEPVWEKSFVFEEMFEDDLHCKRVLEISLWENKAGFKLMFLGRVCLGPQPENSNHEEMQHWNAIFANSGKWVDDVHKIRLH